jgi:hypothetical protein
MAKGKTIQDLAAAEIRREDVTGAIAQLGDAWSGAVIALAECTPEERLEALSDMLTVGWDKSLVEGLREDAEAEAAQNDTEGGE